MITSSPRYVDSHPLLLLRSEPTACPLPQFKINTLGVIHSITAFLPLLRAGSAKKIVVINTGGADVKTVHKQGAMGLAAYSITKCAALMATTKWAIKLQREGFIVVSLTPGLVDTSGTVGEHGECFEIFDACRYPADGLWSGTQGDSSTHDFFVAAAEGFAKQGVQVVLETTDQSVLKQLKVIEDLKPSDNGLLLSHTTTPSSPRSPR